MVIIGDSNTQDIKFGSGEGNVGESYPGKRIKATHINQINPPDCIGYSNIVLACGTNDLRVPNIKHQSEINQLVNKLRCKLSEIKALCPKSKIIVLPVLPTRVPKMNENVMYYNHLVDSMLTRYYSDIWFPGLYGFLDRKSLLAEDLTRDGDSIHLGAKGTARYVGFMKYWVFQREKSDSRVYRSRNQGHLPAHRVDSWEPT